MSEPTTITVAVHDTLPEVLDRLRGATEAPVCLEIPPGSSLFLTANEFRALRTAVDREKLTLTIASGDPLRQQLAAMFGLAIASNGHAVPTPPAKSHRSKEWTSPRAVLQPRAAVEPAATVPTPVLEGDPTSDFTGEPKRAPSMRTLLIGIVAGIAIIGVLGFLATYFFLPRATIAIELKRQPLSDELILGVAPEGAAALPDTDLTVPAQPIVADVTVNLSVPTTGEQLLPDKPAAGPVRLSNPTEQEITVAKGTEITSATGITFQFTADVKAPAAKDGQPSFIDTQVVAIGGGSAGNLTVGALSGKLDSGIYYSNRMGPLAGGTDHAVKVVADTDVELLRKQVQQGLSDQAVAVFQDQLGGGEQVLTASLDAGEINEQFDHQVGEEAETLVLTATARVTAVKYNAADAVSQAEAALRSRLAESAPDGYEIAPSTLILDNPVLLDEDGDGARFRITATASAAASFPPDARDRLANDLAGKDDDEIAAAISALPGVESFDVSYSPGFLGERMPRVAGQIQVETDV